MKVKSFKKVIAFIKGTNKSGSYRQDIGLVILGLLIYILGTVMVHLK